MKILKGEEGPTDRLITIFSLDAAKRATVIVDRVAHTDALGYKKTEKKVTFVSGNTGVIEQYSFGSDKTTMKSLIPEKLPDIYLI